MVRVIHPARIQQKSSNGVIDHEKIRSSFIFNAVHDGWPE